MNANKIHRREVRYLIPFLSCIAFAIVFVLPTLNQVRLFDWDEVNFAECAREMVVSGDFMSVQIGFQPFWEKPPFFIWLQALSMEIFGINEFAARFPNALAAILTLFTLYILGAKLHNKRFGFFWALLYAGSFLPQLYFHSAIIDPWYNLFSFLFFYYYWNIFVSDKAAYLAGIFLGLAILTKGPAILLVSFLTIICSFLFGQRRVVPTLTQILKVTIPCALVGGSWFLFLLFNGRAEIILDFIIYQWRLFSTPDAGHKGFVFYHFVVLLIGCFPASFVALPGFFRPFPGQGFMSWMKILFWVNLILFSIVSTKIIHYSSLCYFPLTYIAAEVLDSERILKFRFNMLIKVLGMILWILWFFVFLSVPFIFMNWNKIHWIIQSSDIQFRNFFLKSSTWGFTDFLPAVVFGILGFFAIIKLFKNEFFNATKILSVSVVITIFIASFTIVPKIESYSQGGLINLIQTADKQGKIIKPIGFKTYADYFYSNLTPQDIAKRNEAAERLFNPNASVGQSTIAVVKIKDLEKVMKDYPCLRAIKINQGFAALECVDY
jgi:hypothetical protein